MTEQMPLLLAGGLAFLAGVAVVLAVAGLLESRFGRRARSLKRHIERVRQRTLPAMAAQIARGVEARLPSVLRWLQQTRLAGSLELLLSRAHSGMSPEGFLGLMAAAGGAGGLIVLLLHGSGGSALLAGALAAIVPVLGLQWRAARRRARFEAQFPEALDFIARSLRAGHGLMAGIGMVASELADPVAGEFGTAFEETNLGMSPGEALARMAARVDSRDLEFFVTAVAIQRETGGNLAELLGGLANTVRERMKLAGKVRALSSEGRLSGLLMTVLPFVLGAILTAINPDYMSLLWTTPEGRQTVAVMLLMMLVGSVWIQMLVRIRV